MAESNGNNVYRNLLWGITITLILSGYGWSYIVYNMVSHQLETINRNLVTLIAEVRNDVKENAKRIFENEKQLYQRSERIERLEGHHK